MVDGARERIELAAELAMQVDDTVSPSALEVDAWSIDAWFPEGRITLVTRGGGRHVFVVTEPPLSSWEQWVCDEVDRFWDWVRGVLAVEDAHIADPTSVGMDEG